MQYQVVVPKKAQKELDKVDTRYRLRILTALIDLGNNPYIGKKLKGKHSGEWSFVVVPYRIIYRIKKQELIVLVIRIKHRQGAYK